MSKPRAGDIDAIRTAIRPRMSGRAGSTTVPPHTHTTLPVHTHSADTITVEPAGNIAADDVQEALEELDAEKLARDGSQVMLGALDMDHHSIANIDDADIEGTVTVGEDVTLTEGVGGAIVGGVRKLHMAGDDSDGEAVIDGLERLTFNDEPTKSIIDMPSSVRLNPAVTPGTDTVKDEGRTSWSDVEGALEADVAEACRLTLGWVIRRWPIGGLGGAAKKVVYLSENAGGACTRNYNPSTWAGGTSLPPFGVTMHSRYYTDLWVWCMTRGIMRNWDTSAWAIGDTIWVALDGTYTNAAPAYSDVAPVIAVGSVRSVDALVGEVDIDVKVYPPHEVFSGRNQTDSHPASAITNTPSGALVAINAQAAIDELEANKCGRRWSYMMKGF